VRRSLDICGDEATGWGIGWRINFGGAAGICEMIAHSRIGEVRLLPALPKALADGCVSGLKLRGGIELKMEWSEGVVREASLYSNTIQTVSVRLNGTQTAITLAAGTWTAVKMKQKADVPELNPRNGTGSMKAAVCEKPGRLVIEERPLPEPAAPGWVPIEISHVGLCGTDYHIVQGKHPYLQYPRVIGHELSGYVAESRGGFSKGELVIINPYIACGTCYACRNDKPNCCYAIGVLGVHRDGGLCERINVPEKNLYRADGLEPFEAAMVEFLAIGAHAVRRSEIGAGARVLVVGVGPIGLGVALFARRQGAKVHLLDTSRMRLHMVRERFGFESLVELEAGPEAVVDLTEGVGFDAVFDATGSARAIETGFAYVAHGGVYVLVSVVSETISFSDPEFHKREMKLIGSRNATQVDFETVIAALKSGAIDTAALRTQSFRLADLPEHFDALLVNRNEVIKAIVEVA
jgi:2-desacetyl-2-hydroxyethyl bacteriochlorophyllide A dehydrogenase